MDKLAGVMHADDGRDAEISCQNRGVRQRAAELGNKCSHFLVLHHQGVSRGQIVGYDYAAFEPYRFGF